MSKIFTDDQINGFRRNGHPIYQLMELVNQHTNNRDYAATNLQMLADIAARNYEQEQADRRRLLDSLK